MALGVAVARDATQVKTPLPGKDGDLLSMDADEPVMHGALRRARAGLADFLELAETPPRHLTGFRVRVALRERNEGEYIWIRDFKEGDNGRFEGVVDDDIHMQTGFKRGDRFTFTRGDIGDWTYTDTRKNRIHGAYTECALMTLAPAAVAAQYRKARKPDCEF